MHKVHIIISFLFCATMALYANDIVFDLTTDEGRSAYISYHWKINRSLALFAMRLWGLAKPEKEQAPAIESAMTDDLAPLADFGALSDFQ